MSASSSWYYILLLLVACAGDFAVNEPISKTVEFKNQLFDVYIVDIQEHPIKMYWKDEQGNRYGDFAKLKTDLKKQGQTLQFATNGGMFTPEGAPQGLYIENGKTIKEIDTFNYSGNFYMMPNGVFGVKNNKAFISSRGEQIPNADFATQSGPMLVIDGKLHEMFRDGSSNKYVRSGVGLINDHKLVFAISKEKCNFYDFASLFKEEFDCASALYLDGAISKMYLPAIGRHQTTGNFGVIIAHSK
jgi:uncharacterized protein YigE (DUF2233 family)